MSEKTFIDLVSLYIQASGIFIALISVYTFFRLEKIVELLIGQGSAVFKRQNDIREGIIEEGSKLSDKHYRRLRDAIDRKNVWGIEEGLIRLATNEINRDNKNNYGNYRHILPKFIETKKYKKRLKNISVSAILLFAFTILLCFFSILSTENYISCFSLETTALFNIVSIFFVSSLTLTGYLIYISNFTDVGFERDKQIECNQLKSKYPEIKKLY